MSSLAFSNKPLSIDTDALVAALQSTNDSEVLHIIYRLSHVKRLRPEVYFTQIVPILCHYSRRWSNTALAMTGRQLLSAVKHRNQPNNASISENIFDCAFSIISSIRVARNIIEHGTYQTFSELLLHSITLLPSDSHRLHHALSLADRRSTSSFPVDRLLSCQIYAALCDSNLPVYTKSAQVAPSLLALVTEDEHYILLDAVEASTHAIQFVDADCVVRTLWPALEVLWDYNGPGNVREKLAVLRTLTALGCNRLVEAKLHHRVPPSRVARLVRNVTRFTYHQASRRNVHEFDTVEYELLTELPTRVARLAGLAVGIAKNDSRRAVNDLLSAVRKFAGNEDSRVRRRIAKVFPDIVHALSGRSCWTKALRSVACLLMEDGNERVRRDFVSSLSSCAGVLAGEDWTDGVCKLVLKALGDKEESVRKEAARVGSSICKDLDGKRRRRSAVMFSRYDDVVSEQGKAYRTSEVQAEVSRGNAVEAVGAESEIGDNESVNARCRGLLSRLLRCLF